MLFNFPTFSLAFLVGGLLTFIFAAVIWARRPAQGVVPFVILMLAITIWLFARTLEAGAVAIEAKILWGKVEYFGIATAGVLWLSFAQDYAGIDWWRRPRNLTLLYIIPLISLFMVWTNEWHRLVWPAIYFSPGTSGAILIWEHGPWFWIMAIYQYANLLIGIYILWRFVFQSTGIYRRQVTPLLIGIIIVMLGNFIYLLGYSPIRGLDLTPFVFVLAGLIHAVSVFRFHFMDIIPVARIRLTEDMPDGIIVLTNEGYIAYMNPAARHLMGLGSAKVLGKHIGKIWDDWIKIAKTSTDPAGNMELEVDNSGVKHDLEVHMAPIKGNCTSIVGRLVILRDITERKSLDAQNKELEREAHIASRLATVGEMAAGIAHEVNNPLTSVIGYSEWLLEKEVPEDMRKNLEVVNKGAKQAAAILNRLLTFAGQFEAKRSYVNINLIIENTLEMRTHSLLHNNIGIIKQMDIGLPQTMADSGQLQQVFLNLILNAEVAMKEAHGVGKLTISTRVVDNKIKISFQDDGPGIPAENMEKLFQPFFTTKGVGQGTGLGLSICYGIIKEHGGRIYAESEFGKGATFFIDLPILAEDKS